MAEETAGADADQGVPDDFIQWTPEDLRKVTVVAQALDNQWAPSHLLGEIRHRHTSRHGMLDQINPHVRAEYLRALINAEQVVINRAFIYNNPVVYQDFAPRGPRRLIRKRHREAFKQLLANGVIVPYLHAENHPKTRPDFPTLAFEAWQALCDEVKVPSLRLSWEIQGKSYEQLLERQINRRFNEFALNAWQRDPETFAAPLGIDLGRAANFAAVLERVRDAAQAHFQANRKSITRQALYEQFVTRPAAPVPGKRESEEQRVARGVTEGWYDPEKPFSVEIKQLLDLAYNVSLPDALGTYTLTPFDAPPRTVLQEFERLATGGIDSVEMMKLVRNRTFALVQSTLDLPEIGGLTLPTVVGIRETDAWHEYIASLKNLLEDPLDRFGDPEKGVQNVYTQYHRLAREVRRCVKARPVQRWKPYIELAFFLAGAAITVFWHTDGIAAVVAGGLAAFLPPESAELVVRLVVRGNEGEGDLSTSVDLIRQRLASPKREWESFVRGLKELPGVQVMHQDVSYRLPTVNQPATG